MFSVLLTQWTKLKRAPVWLLLMLVMTFVFTLVLGTNSTSKMTFPVIADDRLDDGQAKQWLEILNRSDVFAFKLMEENKAVGQVREGKAELAVRLLQDDYRIVAAADNPNAGLVERHIRTQYSEELRMRQAADSSADPQAFRMEVERYLNAPALASSAQMVESTVDFKYNQELQFLFGFTLFFVIYTIAFSVSSILEEKKAGIWDRIILSPVTKTGMYMGHLVYSFLIGCAHIFIMFSVFRFGFGFQLGDKIGLLITAAVLYVLSIVALSILISSLVRTAQQYNAIIPLLSVSMAMLGGAYWPIELVDNPFLIAAAKVVPLAYGMEALKGAAVYNLGWIELAQPLGILALITVLCMGVGINLMERKAG